MAIRLKVCLKCGTLSEEEITKCLQCGGLEFRQFTADDLQKIKNDGNKIAAFFNQWPSGSGWQPVAAKNDLEEPP